MKITIIRASMAKDEDNEFVGKVHFTVEGHHEPYEILLHSKKGRNWGYSLTYLGEPGPEGQIETVDDFLDEDDEAFDALVQAALKELQD